MTPFEQLLAAAELASERFAAALARGMLREDSRAAYIALEVAIDRARAVQLQEVDIDAVHRKQEEP